MEPVPEKVFLPEIFQFISPGSWQEDPVREGVSEERRTGQVEESSWKLQRGMAYFLVLSAEEGIDILIFYFLR